MPIGKRKPFQNLNIPTLSDRSYGFWIIWITSGTQWVPFYTPHAPEKRGNAGMAHHESRQETLLFGGQNGTTLLGDTWVFDGSDWKRLTPSKSPSPRASFGMAYDADNHLIVLFGGETEPWNDDWALSNETWAWTGVDWQQLFQVDAPPASETGNPPLRQQPGC